MIKVLSKREKFIFYATIGVIVFAFIFNFFLAPVLTRNDNLNNEIRLNREKLKNYLWLLNNKEAIKKKYAKFVPADNLTSQEHTGAVDTLSELENLAKNSGIKIIDIRPQQGAKGTGIYKENLIDLRAEGSLENYMKFIYNLENSLSLLRIKKFQISAKPNSIALDGNFLISQLSTSD